MIKKISIILGIFGAIVLVVVLGYAVWRIMQPQSTVTRPKATGGAGQCLPPAQAHLECVSNACVRKIGTGSNQSGCTTVGAACGGTNCPSGQTLCSGVCKNLQTDLANCGACGNACASNQSCTNGTCVNTSCTSDPDCSGGNVCVFP